MSKPVTELEAMQAIDAALSGLEPDAQKRALAWAYSKFLQCKGGAGPDFEAGLEDGQRDDDALGHIKEFIVKKQPATLYERVACLAYHMEKAGKITAFNAKDMLKANTDSRAGKIDNLTSILNDATRQYGYLAQMGNGKKALTARGEALVEALPDRAKVKEALKKHPQRKAKKAKK